MYIRTASNSNYIFVHKTTTVERGCMHLHTKQQTISAERLYTLYLGEQQQIGGEKLCLCDEMMFTRTCTENSNQSVASGCKYVAEQQPISGGYKIFALI
jgi:hypothetical protein